MELAGVVPGHRARVRPWPGDATVRSLVLNDHLYVPAADDIAYWVEAARRSGARAVRTGALFPLPASPFITFGFAPIDRLALLEIDLTTATVRRPHVRTTRLRTTHLDEAVTIDQRAFQDPWSQDRDSLAEIRHATPQTRCRIVRRRAVATAYAISGRANRTGYLQRLAVDPDADGTGLGRALVDDALSWMKRRGAVNALVNTGVDNEIAIHLYEAAGFVRSSDELVVLELKL